MREKKNKNVMTNVCYMKGAQNESNSRAVSFLHRSASVPFFFRMRKKEKINIFVLSNINIIKT